MSDIALADTDNVEWIVGDPASLNAAKPTRPFDPAVLAFLDAWSRAIRAHPDIRHFPDLAAFAFYCRKGNLSAIQNSFGSSADRIGWGRALHIAPSNVPMNFAYSLVMGMLAGNTNVVRLASKHFPQADIACQLAGEVLATPAFQPKSSECTSGVAIVRFARNDAILSAFTQSADALLVWGGDATVAHLRTLPRPARCVELAFADRTSLAVLDAEAVLALRAPQLASLAQGFYNDTYVIDQNACSSPSVVIWHGDDANADQAKRAFWPAVEALVARTYDLAPVSAVDKMLDVSRHAEHFGAPLTLQRPNNAIMRATLPETTSNLSAIKGRLGLFFEHTTQDLTSILPRLRNTTQTLSHFGCDAAALRDLIITHGVSGVDRIVPIGKALDFAHTWDGHDLIATLSRRIIAV